MNAMNKFLFTFFGLLACFEINAQLGYHFDGKYIQLTPNTSEPYYVLINNVKSKEFLDLISNLEFHQNDSNREVYMISDNSFFVSSKPNFGGNNYISEMFQDSKGNPYYVLPRIILSLKDNANISNIIKRFTGILQIDSIQRLKGMITLTCYLSSAKDVLRVVGELDSFEEVEWCEPDMICKWETHDANPLFSMQYYLQNNISGQYDINVVPAWSITTGSSSITVAVIDEGVDPDHEDLSGSVLQGYTIGDATGYGQPQNANSLNYKGHGVACAGIIGARNNLKGILGVAYGVNILPVNVVPYTPYEYYKYGVKYVYNGFTTTDTDLAYAIQWAAERSDILSCSWGSNSEMSVVKTAINNAMSNGRNGKGCIVVASSGNNYPSQSTIQFPARIDGVIAVGAINRYGIIQSYSQRGNELDLVAPSGLCNLQGDVVTTDRMNNLGYNPYAVASGTDLTNTNYTQKFGGTSAACPQVAGVAALMLSANPNLTVSQVRSKLRSTATDLGSTGFDTTFGYGLVNANAAVRSALSGDRIVGPQLVDNYGDYSIENLPSGVTVSWSLSDNHYNTGYNLLLSNCPLPCHCRIFRDHNYDLVNATLTAEIKYNNVTIQTLTKEHLYAYDGFRGQYTSGNLSGNIDYTFVFTVIGNYVTTVTSPNFYGATVTYGSNGAVPTAWGFNPSTGVLNFKAPNGGAPVVINVVDVCANQYTLYAFPTGAKNIDVSYEDNSLTVILNDNDEDSDGSHDDEPWTLEILNAMTGELMTTRNSTNHSTTVSTAGWPKGMYVVRVTIGNEVLTEKVIVK